MRSPFKFIIGDIWTGGLGEIIGVYVDYVKSCNWCSAIAVLGCDVTYLITVDSYLPSRELYPLR